MKNLYDLLTRRNAANDSFTDRFLFYPGNKFSGDLEIDIRFKQCQAYLPQRSVDVRLADNAVPTKIFENLLKFVAKLWKHDGGRFSNAESFRGWKALTSSGSRLLFRRCRR